MADFAAMSDDELADAGHAWFTEVERRIAESDHPAAEECTDLTHRAHRKMNRVRRLLVESDIIQPFSGGLPKSESP